MNFVMAVRDYRELAKASLELVPFDTTFDMVRAVKSEEELVEVRDAMDIILDGFWALVAAYEPGKTEAEIMAPAVERFFARGAGPRMMNILLSGPHGEAEASFKVPGNRVVAANDFLSAPTGRGPGRESVSLHAGHLSNRKDRRRMPCRCAVEIFYGRRGSATSYVVAVSLVCSNYTSSLIKQACQELGIGAE